MDDMDDKLKKIVLGFKNMLEVCEGHQKRLSCFAEYESQLEGWLKGELLYFLNKNNKEFQLQREFKHPKLNGRYRIDFKLTLNNDLAWIETKFWYIGRQKGPKYKIDDYLKDNPFKKDLFKLSLIDNGEKYILILAVINKNEEEMKTFDACRKWEEKIKDIQNLKEYNVKIQEKNINKEKIFEIKEIKNLSNENYFSDQFFLGLLKVTP